MHPNRVPASLVSPSALDDLAHFFDRHPRIALLTGAGISTASGIPDYRDRDGVRRGRAPVQGPEFRASDAVRRRYWARSMAGWPMLARAEPNPGHLAIAALESAGRIASTITQNVDGLHRRAGSMNVVELHGNIHGVLCLACGARVARASLQALLAETNPALAGLQEADALPAPDGDAHVEPPQLTHFRVPSCPHCDGVLQPDVVFFGDLVPRARTEQAEQAVRAADALLVAGSSLMVHSAFRLCRLAAEAGKPLAAINLGITRADALLSLKVEGAAQDILPLLADRLR